MLLISVLLHALAIVYAIIILRRTPDQRLWIPVGLLVVMMVPPIWMWWFQQSGDAPVMEQRLILFELLIGGMLVVTVYQIGQLLSENQKKTAALEAQQDQYRTLVETQSELICEFSPDGTLAFVNQAYADYFGRSREDLIGSNLFELLPDEDRRTLRAHLDHFTPEDATDRIEHAVLTPDGEQRWQEWSDHAFFDAQGHIASFRSIGRDVTTRKLAEQALRASERKFAKAFFASPDAIAITTLEHGTILEANEGFTKHTGYTLDEAIGRSILEMGMWVDEEDRERMIAELRTHGRVREMVCQLRIKSGEERICKISGEPIEVEGLPCLLTVVRDVTEQTLAVHAVSEREARLRAFVDALPGLAFILDEHGFYVEAYAAEGTVDAEELERLRGKNIGDMWPADVAEPILKVIENVLTTGESETITYGMPAAEGDRWYEARVGPMTPPKEKGAPRSVVWIANDITERARAEEKLRVSEGRYRAVVRAIPDAMFRIGADGIYLDYVAAKGFETLLPPHQFLGRHYNEGLPPDIVEMTGRAISVALDTDESQTYEYVLILGGEPQHFEARIVPDGTGAVLALVRNITERVSVEEALRENEERYRSVVGALAEGIALYDADMHLITHNASAERILGLSAEEMGERLLVDDRWRTRFEDGSTLPPDAFPAVRSLRTGESIYGAIMGVEKPNGRITWISVNTEPIFRHGETRAVAVVTSFSDITEERRARDALRVSESRYRSLVENAPEAIVVLDLELGRFVDVNRNAEIFYGLPREQLLRQGPIELSPPTQPDGRRSSEVAMAEIMAAVNGDVRTFEWMHRNVQGHDLPCEIRLLRLPSSERVLIRGSITDISARKAAEAEREHLIAELEAKNAELERFTYTASHDLKAPLFTIQGFAGLLEQDIRKGDPERIRQDIERINAAAEKMRRLLDELLELSRIGRLMNTPEAIALPELVHAAIAQVAGHIRASGATIEVDEAMPVVWGDRVRLLEVFQNLLDNAIKFMGDADAPRVEVGARLEAEAVLCWVRDNGRGIEPVYHDKIFGLFERLEGKGEGTGVGLALVKRIVEVHGGKIWIESDGEERGSTFFFTLPATAPMTAP